MLQKIGYFWVHLYFHHLQKIDMHARPFIARFLGASLLMAGTAIYLTGCGQDEPAITINIQSPADGQIVANPAAVPLAVEFLSADGLHDIEVYVLRESDRDTAFHFDQHTHQISFQLNQTLDLSGYAAGTVFQLEAEAYLDEFGTDKISREIRFSLP
jgi:hypothetical protein